MSNDIIGDLAASYKSKGINALNAHVTDLFNEGGDTGINKRFTFFLRREKYTMYYLLYIYKLNTMKDRLTYYVHGGSAWLRATVGDRQFIVKDTKDIVKFIENTIMPMVDNNISKCVSLLPQNWDISIFCEQNDYDEIFLELQQYLSIIGDILNINKNNIGKRGGNIGVDIKKNASNFKYDTESKKFTQYYVDEYPDKGYCATIVHRKDMTRDFIGNPLILCRYKTPSREIFGSESYRSYDCDGCDKKLSGKDDKNPGFMIIWSAMHVVPDIDLFNNEYIKKVTSIQPAVVLMPKNVEEITGDMIIDMISKSGGKRKGKKKKKEERKAKNTLKEEIKQSIIQLDVPFSTLKCPILNIAGLMMNTTMMKAQNVNRTPDKKIDIDTFRLGLVTSGKSMQEILNGYKNLRSIWNDTFLTWSRSDIKQFFLNEYENKNMKKTINQQIVENTMMEDGETTVAIALETDTMTKHRAIINTIVIDLNMFFKTYKKDDIMKVDVFIVGGDSWGRYIDARTSDIDIKVVITPFDYKKGERDPNTFEYKKGIKHPKTGEYIIPKTMSVGVQYEIGRILSKYIVYLNYIVKDLDESYRMREADRTQTETPFYLMSIDYKGAFPLAKYNLSNEYAYDLPILDVSTVFNNENIRYTEMYNEMPLNLSDMQSNANFPGYIDFEVYSKYNLTQMRLPVGNMHFLEHDLRDIYKTQAAYELRFFRGKLEKDVKRYINIKSRDVDNQDITNNIIDPIISISMLENVYPYSVNLDPYPCMYHEYYNILQIMNNKNKTKNKMPYNIDSSAICNDDAAEMRLIEKCDDMNLTEENYYRFCTTDFGLKIVLQTDAKNWISKNLSNFVKNYDGKHFQTEKHLNELKGIQLGNKYKSKQQLLGDTKYVSKKNEESVFFIDKDEITVTLSGDIYKTTDDIASYIMGNPPYFFSGTVDAAETMRKTVESERTFAVSLSKPLKLLLISSTIIDDLILAINSGSADTEYRTLLGWYDPKYTRGYELQLALGYGVTCKEQGDFIDDIGKAQLIADFRIDVEHLKNEGWKKKREGCVDDPNTFLKRIVINKLNYIIAQNLCEIIPFGYDGYVIPPAPSSYGFDIVFPYQIVLCASDNLSEYRPILTVHDKKLLQDQREMISYAIWGLSEPGDPRYIKHRETMKLDEDVKGRWGISDDEDEKKSEEKEDDDDEDDYDIVVDEDDEDDYDIVVDEDDDDVVIAVEEEKVNNDDDDIPSYDESSDDDIPSYDESPDDDIPSYDESPDDDIPSYDESPDYEMEVD
jgi:hypothetical protein